MRFVSFERQGKRSWGAIQGEAIVDLRDRFPTLRDAIAADALDELKHAVEGAPATVPLAEIRYLPPIPYPEKIICVGVNYANRNAEYKDGSDLPKYPSLFLRTPGSFVGHNEPIIRPRESDQLDYEGEIALIIGKPGRRIAESDYWSHVAGLTCLNEGTIRDWVRHGKFNVTPGKNFDKTGSCGPWMVTRDEFQAGATMAVKTLVNGESRQDDTTESLIFSFGYLLHYISSFTTLVPGDVVSTGTPVGAGARFDPPKWLKPGDVVEVTVPGIGTLRNPVADEA
jgi:5-carboxymethyl-2-hydroxymuconate isomerase